MLYLHSSAMITSVIGANPIRVGKSSFESNPIVAMKQLFSIVLLVGLGTSLLAEDEPIFSGPQAGEKVTSFDMQHLIGEAAGEKFDPVANAKDGPLVLIFVHKITRPSVAVVRTVTDYAAARKKDGLSAATILLTDDVTETENFVKRASHALPKKNPVGVYTRGAAGPGAYGLNRNVTLTVVVAKEGKATANFALIQPSVQADAVKIAGAISKTLGDEKPPTMKDLAIQRQPADAAMMANLRPLLVPLIQKDATPKQVETAAKNLQEAFEKNPALKVKVREIANRIITAGKLENYGTAEAQEWLKKWAKEE